MAKKYAFGVDIGGTTVKIGFFTLKGKLLNTWEIPTDRDFEGDNILPDIAESIREHLEKAESSFDEVAGIGMGVPGPVLGDGTINKCVNLGWGVLDASGRMSELCDGAFVRCGNDANVAALGEMWQGGGRGYANIVMVTLGTGVGGGVIVNGRIVSGAFGAGGEIGHIKVRDDEPEACGCGKHGCLEQYASATGIVRLAEQYLASHDAKTVLTDAPAITSKVIFDAARNGDAVSIELVDTLGRYLGTALSYIACVVDPEAFVIGGGVSKAGEILLDTIRRHYRENAFHASRGTKFALAELENEAGMYGAVKLVLN